MLRWIIMHKPTTEYHYPGHQYTGPGTNVVYKIYNGIYPVNYQDAVTLLHDIDYMSYINADLADDKAISLSDYSLAGIATSVGLTLRKMLGLRFNSPSPIGMILKQYMHVDEGFRNILLKYGLFKYV